MHHLRRVLGPLIAVWLLCQAGTAAAVWLPAFDDCACPHGDGAVCAMHHPTSNRAGARPCSMRGLDQSTAVTLVSLLSPAAPAPESPDFTLLRTSTTARPADVPADGLRPVPPDPPPPRA